MSATNVQFSVALHLMAVLGYQEGREYTSADLACSVNTNASFVRRSLSKLVKAGLVDATRGKNGAYRIARSPKRVTLLDVYRASGAPCAFAIHDYEAEPDCPISANIKPCTADVLATVQGSFESALATSTVADVVSSIRKKAK